MFGTALDQDTDQVYNSLLSTVAQIFMLWKAASSIDLQSLLKSPLFLRLASAAGTVAPPAVRSNVNGCLMLTESSVVLEERNRNPYLQHLYLSFRSWRQLSSSVAGGP